MPLLGIFSRNKKSRNGPESTPTTPTQQHHDSTANSPTAEYVTPDKSLPSNPNGKNIYHNTVYPSVAASSAGSKLRIPFTRKSSASASVSSVATDKPGIPPRPSFTSHTTASVDAEDHTHETRPRPSRSHLRPPPSKSAIFVAYGDPHSALSTRSLPAESTHPKSLSDLPPSPPLPSLPSAKKSFFSWAKGKSKTVPDLSKSSPPPSLPAIASPSEQDSFNLKAFRHLSPPSPDDALPSPRPRPRVDSFASDSSQRISVAAFREAQSRRSLAGSPVPSFRSPSPGPLGSNPHLPRGANDSPRVSRNGSPPAPRQTPPVPAMPPAHARNQGVGARRSTAPTLSVASSSALTASIGPESSSEESSEEEDSEDDRPGDVGLVRQRTITKGNADMRGRGVARNPEKAKSESGHGFGNWRPGERAQSSFELLRGGPVSAVGANSAKANALPPRSQSSLGIYGSSRPMASVSTSALTSSAPVQRPHPSKPASTANTGPGPGSKHIREAANAHARPNHSSSSSASSSSSDSEDDAPLATLVGPKRPGSSVSTTSGPHAKAGSVSSHRSHTKPPPAARKPLIDIATLTAPAAASSAPGFTGGATLLAGGKVVQPPVAFVSPPASDASSVSDAPVRSALQQKISSAPGVLARRAAPVSKGAQPPRRDTASPPAARRSTASPVAGRPAASPPAPARKDGVSSINFSERLSKVVQQNVGKGPEGATSRAEKEGERKDPGASRPRAHHRRASSDQTIAWRDTVEGGVGGAAKGEPRRSGDGERKDRTEPIVPTPIRERDPPPAFSVTSRPRQHPEPSPPQPRPRSTTLLSPPTPSAVLLGAGGGERPPNPRQRSTTMVPHSSTSGGLHAVPAKPFAERRESPASSTGGSSSGRVPLTPRDGSEVGAKSDWGSGVSGLAMAGGKGHAKKPSVVSFEEEGEVRGRERRFDEKESAGQGENRRNERRRTEAKAAIELGNVINGPGPNLDDEDGEDDDVPVSQAMGARMGMMGMGGPMPMGFPSPATPGWAHAWQQQQQQQHLPPMLSPAQFMIPPPADPNFFAAHQQAMMIAKQAYQMAVAQQALAAAGEEWERGSSAGGFGGAMSMYGGSSPPPMPMPVPGLMGGMGMANGWPAGSMLSAYGGSARSDYGGARSDYGGGGGGGWGSSKSVYGESFGPAGDRARPRRGSQPRGESGYFAGAVPPLPDRGASGNGGGGGSGDGAREGKGRARTTSVPNPPISPHRANFGKKVLPPSSWKAGGGV